MVIIERTPSNMKEKVLAGALLPIRQFLPVQDVESWCRESKHVWRERHWGPAIALLGCIWKQLLEASAREVEDWLASLGSLGGKRDGHDFCAARERVPVEIFKRAVRHVGEQPAQQRGRVFRGLRVQLLDGTTSRVPRSKANADHFGHSRNGHRCSTLPVVRWMVLVCAGSAAVVDAAVGAYACSEMRLARDIIERLSQGRLLVTDRGLSAFLLLYLAHKRGSHVLARQHQTRRGTRVRKLGLNDEIHSWARPSRWRTVWPDLLSQCPPCMEVRVIRSTVRRPGYRDSTLEICTTLLDPELYSREALVELYLERWNVEVDLRTLKGGYGLTRLTGRTPGVVEREIYSGLLAYNCVRALQASSALQPRKLSHERSRTLLMNMAERMSGARTAHLPELYKLLLKLIGETHAIEQERLPEPRALVQRPSTFPVLTTTRRAWRKKHAAA